LCEHLIRTAIDLALIRDGVRIESKRAMIAITTSNSTRLKPLDLNFFARTSPIINKHKLKIQNCGIAAKRQ
jgi:hypothetical protein